MTRKLKPVHPGDVLKHDFLEPLGLTPYRLAKEIGVSVPTVNDIVRGRRAVTADTALRLSHYFGTSAEVWLGLQAGYDLEVTGSKVGKRIAALPRHAQA